MSDPKVVAVRKSASEAQIQANRENARKSTGPKSVEGKARASQNAISHGFFSRKVVLEGENAQEFEQLRKGLMAEHQPKTVTEQFLVERMAISMWRLNRLQEIETEAHADMRNWAARTLSREQAPVYQTVPATTIRILTGSIGQSILEKLEIHEKRLEGTLHRSLRELEKMRKAESEGTKPIPEEVAEEVMQDEVGEGVVNEVAVPENQPGNGLGELEPASRGAFSPSPQPSPSGGEGAG